MGSDNSTSKVQPSALFLLSPHHHLLKHVLSSPLRLLSATGSTFLASPFPYDSAYQEPSPVCSLFRLAELGSLPFFLCFFESHIISVFYPIFSLSSWRTLVLISNNKRGLKSLLLSSQHFLPPSLNLDVT